MKSEAERGKLLLIVGPSGAGKDSLLDGARARLGDSPDHVFVRRDITRPADAGGEDHIPMTVEMFEAKRAAGAYGLSWGAHGLFYGVPASIAENLAHGAQVIVNVSRSVLDEARALYGAVRVINITVPPDVLEQRLRNRGRESEDDIRRRLARADEFRLDGPDVVTFVNDRPMDEAVDAFTDLLRK